MNRFPIFAVVLLLIIGAIFVYWLLPNERYELDNVDTVSSVEEMEYMNETYGYSFTYPSTLSVNEYTPEIAALGTSTTLGFNSLVEVSVAESEADDAFTTFDEFLLDRGSVLCAADSPTESMSCTSIEAENSFVTASGIEGEVLYFALVTTDLETGASTTDAFGPVYAFDVGGYATSSDVGLLMVYQPLASFIEEENPALVQSVAVTLDLNRTASAPVSTTTEQ